MMNQTCADSSVTMNLTCTEGAEGSVTLKCNHPRAHAYTWFKDGEVLTPDNIYGINTTDNNRRAILPCNQELNNTTYQCASVRNRVKRCSPQVTLTVLCHQSHTTVSHKPPSYGRTVMGNSSSPAGLRSVILICLTCILVVFLTLP